MIMKYPYTDYNEYNMDWIIKTVKDLTVQWAETHQEWVDTKAEWVSYKNYIDNYFANLDLTQEVSDKLNQMAADGVIKAIFNDTVATIAGQVTSDWIADNLLQETGYVIDTSLTVANAAADAEAAGNAITKNATDIERVAELTIDRTRQLFNKDNADIVQITVDQTGSGYNAIDSGVNRKSVVVPVSGSNFWLSVKFTTTPYRYGISFFAAYPEVGMTSLWSMYGVGNSTVSDSVREVNGSDAHYAARYTGNDAVYALIMVWHENDADPIDDILDSIMIQYGKSYTGYEDYLVGKPAKNMDKTDAIDKNLNRLIFSGWQYMIVNQGNGSEEVSTALLPYHTSDYYKLPGAPEYAIMKPSETTTFIAEYDTDKVWIQSLSVTTSANYTPSATCEYIRITTLITNYEDIYLAYGSGHYFAFGDSLVKGILNGNNNVQSTFATPNAIGSACNLTVHNIGQGGQAFLNTGYNPDTALDTVMATDFSSADLITLSWGRNDTTTSPLGAATDASGASTICGQLKAILDYIIANNTTAQIVIITPPPSSVWFDYTFGTGWSIDDMTDTFKIIGANYCVPVLDYRECTVCNQSNWLTVTTAADRVHPTNAGYKKLGAYLAGKVSSFFKQF